MSVPVVRFCGYLKRYIAHQVYVEGSDGATLKEKEQAVAAKWHRDLRNLDIARRGTGLDTQRGVVGAPRTEGSSRT